MELMMVIAVIGFIASIVLLALGQSRLKARDSTRVQDVKNIIKSMELYFSENNTYPIYGSSDAAYDMVTALTNSTPPLAPNYINSVPADPLTPAPTTQPYLYTWGNGGKDYGIEVYFESDGAYCAYRSSGGLPTWFANAPSCTR